MKTFKFLTVAAAVIVLAASCTSYRKAEKGIESPLPTAAETDSVSYLVGVNFGFWLKINDFADNLGQINVGLMKQGMKDYFKAEGNREDPGYGDQFKIDPEHMTDAFLYYSTKIKAYKAEIAHREEKKFLDANKLNDGVAVTESGLQYIIYDEGNEIKPTNPKDTVWVQYTGTLRDGTVFESSDREQPAIKMYMNRVVRGWTEGLSLIGEGGHIQLFIPSELAYGDRATRNIEANSTLIFDIELEKVGQYVEKEKEDKK